MEYTDNDIVMNDDKNGDFKEPLPQLNKIQTKILQRNKTQIMTFFSKLHCIKTCMTKLHFRDDHGSVGSKQICFEKVEDDFET